jgi:hypothetical protein
MRRIAIVLAAAFPLAGCESNLLLPMEPTAESAAASRRALTEAEKLAISDAVSLDVKDARPQDFVWPPLVVGTRGGVGDYCGVVRTTGEAGRIEYHKYHAQIRFDGSGKIAKVDLQAVVKDKGDNVPTRVDSVCMQDGYSVFPVPK